MQLLSPSFRNCAIPYLLHERFLHTGHLHDGIAMIGSNFFTGGSTLSLCIICKAKLLSCRSAFDPLCRRTDAKDMNMKMSVIQIVSVV